MRFKIAWKIIFGFFALAFIVHLILGCEGKQGPTGPQGPAGVSLIKEYTGTIPFDGHHVLKVPEITGKRNTTFVMAYWTFSTTPDSWTPMADGWLDNVDYAKMFCVSWTHGEVFLIGMLKDDLYLLQVFEHD